MVICTGVKYYFSDALMVQPVLQDEKKILTYVC